MTATKSRNYVLTEVADLEAGDLYLLNLNTYLRKVVSVSLDTRYRGRPIALTTTKLDGTDRRIQRFQIGKFAHKATDW